MGKGRLKVLHHETVLYADSIRSFLFSVMCAISMFHKVVVGSSPAVSFGWKCSSAGIEQQFAKLLPKLTPQSKTLFRYCYCPTVVVVVIAITIVEVPYEGSGSPRFYFSIYETYNYNRLQRCGQGHRGAYVVGNDGHTSVVFLYHTSEA